MASLRYRESTLLSALLSVSSGAGGDAGRSLRDIPLPFYHQATMTTMSSLDQ